MPTTSVTLQPGVNVERTPMLLRAGVSRSSLIRYRDSLIQKLGGWTKFYPYAVSGTPRDLHAWKDLNGDNWLAVATVDAGSQLSVISNGVASNITPQTLVSDFAPNISTVIGSPIVTIVDPNITNVTTYDSVFFNTPVSHGGIILDGLYRIEQVTGDHSYQIRASTSATFTSPNPSSANAPTVAGNNTLNFVSTPTWVIQGMTVADVTTPAAIPAGTTIISTTGTTAVMSNPAAAPGVGNGDHIVFSALPVFTTTNGSANVSVFFPNSKAVAGDIVVFPVATIFNGIEIEGSYEVVVVIDQNNFTIDGAMQATASGSKVMNNGLINLTYYIALGPPAPGVGYGLGAYGDGYYGTGTVPANQTGTGITATDWTDDNWGSFLISCPETMPIFYWNPQGGFQNSQVITEGPPINNGVFVSTSQQILISFGSSIHQKIGYQQQPLLVQWSDVANFFEWEATSQTQAGNFPIPIGSEIRAGAAVSNQNLIWTDLDLWAMSYIGPPEVYTFNKIGAGMGAVSKRSVQQLRGSVFWMGASNFYSYTSGGANVLPCPVWDAVYQNLNTSYLRNIRAMPNTPFNEAGWLYPSLASTNGECDSYVKMNITEPGAPWDIGPMARSAWIDQTVFGPPIGASPQGFIYQHETSPDADGTPIVSSFTTGYFYLDESEDYVFVDMAIPDFKYTTYVGGTSAQIQLSFNAVNYPGDTPTVHGPYTVTTATKFITLRIRCRLLSLTCSSSDIGSFWRQGSIKLRFSKSGRR